MRVMAKLRMDVEAGSRAIETGSIGQVMEQVFSELQPEAAYFGPENGRRCAYIIFDMKHESDLTRFEPIFKLLKAEIDVTPVMNREDLQAGLQRIAQGG